MTWQNHLDPGIRVVVLLMNDAGFETTDSGDGISKTPAAYAEGCAIPFRHVAVATTPEQMLSEAHRLQTLLDAFEPDEWTVEANYSPRERQSILFARVLDARER